MERTDDIVTPRGVRVPMSACRWTFARASGPGGQHVNRSDTKATLTVDVTQIEHPRLAAVVDRYGTTIQVTASATRSQLRNRQACVAKLDALLDALCDPPVERAASVPTRATKQRRLDEKRRHGDRKRDRRRPGAGED